MRIAKFWDVIPCGACRTDVSEERSASVIRATRIGVLGTLAVNRRLMLCEEMTSISSQHASVASYG
jgi:hypothetical protein